MSCCFSTKTLSFEVCRNCSRGSCPDVAQGTLNHPFGSVPGILFSLSNDNKKMFTLDRGRMENHVSLVLQEATCLHNHVLVIIVFWKFMGDGLIAFHVKLGNQTSNVTLVHEK